MSYLTDYITRVKAWIDDEDVADVAVTEWIRDCEERLNDELRTDLQIVRTYATFDDNCAELPADWLETIYVRFKGGKPLDFISNHDYWDLDNPPYFSPADDPDEVYPTPSRKALYTTIGRTLFVWPPVDPNKITNIEIAYYRKLIPLGDTKDIIFDRYPSIYRYATLAAGAPYLIEDERLQTWASLATAGITRATNASKKARFSGSPISPRIKGFG